MTLFDYIINFAESFIICFFAYRYFSLNLKKMIILNIIIFLEITIGNIFISSSLLPVFFVTGTLILVLRAFGIKLTIELIVINISILIIDMICNMLALAFTILLNSRGNLFPSDTLMLSVAIFISKILFFICAFFFSKIKLHIKTKLDTKRWTSIVILFFLLLMEFYILIQDVVQDNINKRNIFICIVIIGVISVLVWNMYNKILLENEEKVCAILKNEEIKYKKENYNMLTKMSEDIYQLEHNMRYLLMMLRYAILKENYDECLNLIAEYMKKFDKFMIIVNTNNPYFDFLINQKINGLLKDKIDVSVIISISQNDFYLGKEYVEYVLLIINTYKDIAKKITINIQEVDSENILNLTVTKKNNGNIIFENRFYELIDYLDAQYVIDQVDDLIIFKSIQKI